MARDFTFEKYRELLECMQRDDYRVMTVVDYLTASVALGRTVVLRHDVDRNARRALAMAQLEHNIGIHSTYYFRTTKHVFLPDVIRAVAGMGHEVGYHYETLDKMRGNHEAAIRLFERELAEFRMVCDVRTIAMHGNPLTKWDNRDLWKQYSFEDFALLGEAYLSFGDITYLSDTGRTWSSRNKTKDWLPSMAGRMAECPQVDSIDDVMQLLRSGQEGPLYILAHPERWASTFGEWIYSLGFDMAANVAKRGLLSVRQGRIPKTGYLQTSHQFGSVPGNKLQTSQRGCSGDDVEKKPPAI